MHDRVYVCVVCAGIPEFRVRAGECNAKACNRRTVARQDTRDAAIRDIPHTNALVVTAGPQARAHDCKGVAKCEHQTLLREHVTAPNNEGKTKRDNINMY